MTSAARPDVWRCPACLASNSPEQESCLSCRCALVLAERYVIVEPLAAQGPTRTLAGVDRHEGIPVVIKTLSVSDLGDWKQLELFQRGIAVLRGLQHPGIPEHRADGELTRGGETLYFWVQERIEGRTLADGLAAGQRWTERRARALADAILDVLEYLQGFSPPILHRDIKPSNIVERTGGGWVLIDFDMVKDTLDPEGGATVALGTAGYAPLEQLMGRAGPASDLYGLGATLVALLSRKSPADLLDPEHGGVEFRGHIRVSDDFGEFIAALLEPRVDRRPADARRARTRLLALGDRTSPVSADASGPGRLAAQRRRLLATLVARRHALADATPRAAATSLARSGTTLAGVEPSGAPVVRVEPTLAELHRPPWWERPTRLAILVAAGLGLPASGGGAVLVIVLGVLWIVSGFVVRYPVTLRPGRALFEGGLSNTSEPGRYWLRRRWSGNAHSIPLHVLRIHWRPAPTRLRGGAEEPWLEIDLEIWVRPRSDEVGQFTALMKYWVWHQHPATIAKQLREEVLGALVERLDPAQVPSRTEGRRLDVEATDLRVALDEGLGRLGLERVAVGRARVQVLPRTEDLSNADQVVVDAKPSP